MGIEIYNSYCKRTQYKIFLSTPNILLISFMIKMIANWGVVVSLI